LTIEVIDRLDDFTRMRSQWNELLRASAADCPFLTWEWMHAWWTHLRGSSALRIVAVFSDRQLIAIAPLRESPGALSWFSKLEFLGTGGAGSDYLDVIAHPDFEVDALEALKQSIHSERLALRLSHASSHSLASRLVRGLTTDGWTMRSVPSGTCPFIPLAGQSWDSYLATRGSSHRANFRRRLKVLNREFAVRFEQITTDQGRSDVLDALIGFHRSRWGQEGSTAFKTSALRAFHHDFIRRASEAGWLRLYALYLNHFVAAAMYAFSYNGKFYFYQHGFDRAYQQYSIGLLQMGFTIRAAIDEGAIEFDMLYGTESYKRLWADEAHALERFDLFPAHFRGRLHQRRVEAESTLRAFARRLLTRHADAA
jgi:CelD/BcsL family acetyltransferase involved in cellulose biosynthesis